MMHNKHAAMMERKQEIAQQKIEAGSIATHFPEVAGIDMNMTYNQKGTRSILRTFHFTPNSYAYFIINCLRQGCDDGGFDLTRIVDEMISHHRVHTKGTLICAGTDSDTSHSDIAYEVAIQYI